MGFTEEINMIYNFPILSTLFRKNIGKRIIFGNKHVYPQDLIKVTRGDEFELIMEKNPSNISQSILLSVKGPPAFEISREETIHFLELIKRDKKSHDQIMLDTSNVDQELANRQYKKHGDNYRSNHLLFLFPSDTNRYVAKFKIVRTPKDNKIRLTNGWMDNGDYLSGEDNTGFMVTNLSDGSRRYVCNYGYINLSFDGLVFTLRRSGGPLDSVMDATEPDILIEDITQEIEKENIRRKNAYLSQ
ncbi:hypothetical protein J4421_04695 [Candidatus Woesearchaeota archaeon]|nr:hypothetical protein [Candidatus Woesearchaeota archaeon]